MRDYIERACEEIDAAMFSGDAFIEKDERDALINYIGRWQRQLKAWEEIAAESADGGEKQQATGQVQNELFEKIE